MGLVGFAVIMWSLAPSLISRLASRDPSLDPLAFNGWRMLFALIFTLPIAVLLGFPCNVPWMSLVFHLGVIVGGVVSTVVGDTMFVYAISRTGASIALPTAYLFVVWTGLVDYLLGVTSWSILAAAVLSVGGIWLVYYGGGRGDPKGFVAAIVTSLIWTASNYGYKWAVEEAYALTGNLLAASVHVATLRAVYTVALLAPIMARWSVLKGPVETIGASLTGYVLGALAYIAALSLLPASIVSVGLSANPILVQLVAWTIAGEKLRGRVIVGSILLSIGIAIAATT